MKKSTIPATNATGIPSIHSLQSSREKRIVDANGRLGYLRPSASSIHLFDVIRPTGEVISLPVSERIVLQNGQFSISSAFESLRPVKSSFRCVLFDAAA